MKISPMRLRMNTLKESIEKKDISQIETLLNNSKGTGTTSLLIEIAKQHNVPIVVGSEKTAEELRAQFPEIKFVPFDQQLPGQKVLIDPTVMWKLLREAQAIRMQAKDLLDWMEYKNPHW